MALQIDHTLTEKLTHRLLVGDGPTHVVYRGQTTTASATEIFIDGVTDFVLQPPPESVGFVEAVVMGYNDTDSAAPTGLTVVTSSTKAYFSRIGATMTVTQATDVANVHDDAVCILSADDTDDHIVVQVDGDDGTDTVTWEVHLWVYCTCTSEYNTKSAGDYDATNK